MAVYRGDYHLDRAIDSALAIKGHLSKQEAITAGEHTYKADISIGINSGEMISGNIGSASLKRLDYTVIGDCVNTAQRLQSVAKAGQIIISEEVYEKVKESFRCEKIGEATLKNKTKPAVIYEVLE
jgi:adenylate cyclase